MGFGTFNHRCFEVLGAKPDLKERIPQITGVEIEPDELEKSLSPWGNSSPGWQITLTAPQCCGSGQSWRWMSREQSHPERPI